MESSAIHQTTTIIADYNPKQDKTPDNLRPKQRAALKSLMKKRSQLRFFPADKGNATVILNDQQYIDKVEEHIESSGCYTILNKEPTTPIHNKLYRIFLKFKKEGKINSETMRNIRQLHPRWPQLYGQPKIHKLAAPICPVVSLYNTPLSALHKVLARYLKPLANSSIRLKDTNDFKQHLNTTGHPNFPYQSNPFDPSVLTTPTLNSTANSTHKTLKE